MSKLVAWISGNITLSRGKIQEVKGLRYKKDGRKLSPENRNIIYCVPLAALFDLRFKLLGLNP